MVGSISSYFVKEFDSKVWSSKVLWCCQLYTETGITDGQLQQIICLSYNTQL